MIWKINFILETLLQPKFHKKVSTQQAPAKEEIVRTTKYVLTHQNLDSQGEIITDFVKVKFIYIKKKPIN